MEERGHCEEEEEEEECLREREDKMEGGKER